MNIFDLIISPFIIIIKQLFLFSYSLTSNYGSSIILLSFAISLLLLPIFIFIEKAKKRDDIIKLKMKPLVDEIKLCYKGQERYYYLKTLNRQFEYSPLRALIPILSLLLQIPFFIAAYQFLEGFEPLSGVSFILIKDLAEPDALFGAVNILPIAMTLVNLLTAYFYTRNGDASEQKQMLIVAGVFLILLFNLPSGLVLYWTMNNVFSFFRLFITNREVFRRNIKQEKSQTQLYKKFRIELNLILPKLKKVLLVISIMAIFSQINWAFNNNFGDIYIRLIGSIFISLIITLLIGISISFFQLSKSYILEFKLQPKFFYSILFLVIYFYLAGKYYFTGVNSSLIYIATLIVIPLQLVGLVYIINEFKRINQFIGRITTFLLISILISQLLSLIAFIGNKEIALSISNIIINVNNDGLLSFVLAGIFFSIIAIPFYIKQHNIKAKTSNKSNWIIYFLSVLYVTSFIFFWNPLTVFASFPEIFDFAAIDILKNNFNMFVVIFLSLMIIYFTTPNKYKLLLLILFLVIVVVSFVHNTIIPINVGTLQVNKFIDEGNIAAPLYYYFIEGFAILSIVFAIIWIINRKYFKQLVIGLIILNSLLASHSLYKSGKSGRFFPKDNILSAMQLSLDSSSDKSEGLFPEDNPLSEMKHSISFSKDKENILFIIPDMFQGWNMNKMIKENPEILNELEGFTWYPNTISISRVTNTSIAPLLGGSNYTPNNLDKDTEHTVEEKTSAVLQELADKVHEKGLNFTSSWIPYSTIREESYSTFLPRWTKEWDIFNDKLNIGLQKETGYSVLMENALFYSVPLFIKPKIYNQGQWLQLSIGDDVINKNTWITSKYHFLRLLPNISTVNTEKPNFILLYSSVPHFPWHITDDDGAIIYDVSPYENSKWVIKIIAKWIEWMKENEVYDNTKIIIVSDHGTHWKHFKDDIDIDIPFENIQPEKASLEDMLDLNPLLLVKDYNSNEPMKKDWRFMTNMDANSIAFGENDPTKGLPPESRVLSGYISRWSKDMNTQYKFVINHHYLVRDNIFDANNWKKIEGKE